MRADEQELHKRRECRTSERLVTKSISIKDTKRRCGGCARKVVELTSGELSNCREQKTTEPRVIGAERATAVSSGHSR